MEWHALILSVLLLSLIVGTDSRSLEQVCSKTCERNVVRKFFARDNYEYSYSYQTAVESSFHAAASDDQKAKLNIEVPFSITTGSDCNLVLQIKRGAYFDNRRPETQDELAWQEAVTARPLYFEWENGSVKQVCPSTEDPIWVVNFKKGILSAMQSSVDSSTSGVEEVDTSGTCESDYFVQDSTIRKTKDYSTCKNRNEHLLFSWSMPYEFNSLRQNYIQSSQACEQTVRDVLARVECNEEHTFRPFSTDEAGAKTSISQVIIFLSQQRSRSNEVENLPIRRTNLEQENEAESSSAIMSDKTLAAKQILSEICTDMDGESYNKVSKQFMSLIFAIRQLDSESLTELHEHVNTCPKWRSALKQMLANTLPFCGTEGCVSFASSLILGRELEGDVAKRWLTGFGLIKEPTIQMISSVLDIVESNMYPSQSFLSIGSMIHQYCENSEDDCMSNAQIRTSIEVIMQHLGTNCRSTNVQNRKLILMALRAIGNAGQSTSVPTLKHCIAENLNSYEVRIAAVDAFRRMSCGTDRSGLLTTLEDVDEDSELRIAAYRNLMVCPTDQLLVKVKALLKQEKNLQVGSYIWSHISQVQETEDPLKIFFKKLFTALSVEKFDLDPRKYSRYYEHSMFSENFNSGGSAEASLVWSPKSFVPRTASANVTLLLFGQAINFFEVGGRVEGAENYLQSILEPENFEKRKAAQISDSGRLKNTRESLSAKPHMSWFMRVFGKEMVYGNTELMDNQDSEESSMLSDMISKFMSSDGYTYHDDAMLLNSAHTLPTGIGMPLYLSFNGSSSVDVRAKGKFDFSMGPTPKYKVKGEFTPRAAITVSGAMIVDSHVKKTGIATESIAYTSTSASGSVQLLNGGQNFALEMNTPFAENMVMKFNHQLVKVLGDSQEPLRSSRIQSTERTCLDECLGQRLCYTSLYNEDSTSNLIFPESGEIELAAYMEKTDSELTKYTLSGSRSATYENEDDMIPSSILVRADFDTPGTTVNRKTLIMASYSIPDMQISMVSQRGDDVTRVQGFYISNENEKKFELSANVNGETYSFKSNAQKTMSEQEKELSAEVSVELPDKVMNVNAMSVYRSGQSLEASFEMTNVLPTPVLFRVNLKDLTEDISRLSFSGDVEMTLQPFINSKWLVDMELNPDWENIALNLNYKIGESPKESINFYHKRTNQGQNGETKWLINHMLSSTQFQSLNYKVNVGHTFSKQSIISTVDFACGSRMAEDDNPYQAKFKQEYSNKSNATATVIDGLLLLEMPFAQITREVKGSYVSSDTVLSVAVEGSSDGRSHSSKLLWKSNGPEAALMDQELDFELYSATIGKWKATNKLHESPKDIYKVKSTLSLGLTDELQFVQDTEFVNLPTNKTIRFNLKKGGEKGILRIESSNIGNQELSFSSKNLIHVDGFEPRGLNVRSKVLPKGYATSIEFLKSSVVSVGADFSTNSTDNGRHFSISVEQHDVQESKLFFNFGYEYIISKLLESYVRLSEGESTIFSSHIELKQLPNDAAFGNFSIAAKEHSSLPFSKGLDFDTKMTATGGNDCNLNINHHNNDQRLIFNMERVPQGVQGSLDQNYATEIEPISYSVQYSENDITFKIRDDDGQAAVLVLVKGNNRVSARWSNNVPSLQEMFPKTAGVTYKKATTGFNFTMNSGEETFDMSFRDSWPKTHEFHLENSLVSILPTSMHWSASYKKSVGQVSATLNSENMVFKIDHADPDDLSMSLHQNFEIFERLFVPQTLELSHVLADDTTTQTVSISMMEKSINLKSKSTPAKLTVTFSSSGVAPLPESATIVIVNQIREKSSNIECDMEIDEVPYKLSLTGSFDFTSGATNFPYITFTGQRQINVGLLKNGEKIFGASSTLTIEQEEVSHTATFVQKLFDSFPQNIQKEQRLISNEDEYALIHQSTIGDSTSRLELRYSPQKLTMSQTITEYIPQDLTATYSVGIEQGSIEVQSEAERSNLVSASYRLSENSFRVSSEHRIASIAEVLPGLMEFEGSMNGQNSITAEYTWGTHTGSVSFERQSTESMTINAEADGTPLVFKYTYNLTPEEFSFTTAFTLKDNEFDLALSYDLHQEDRIMKGAVSGGLKLKDQEFSVESVIDVLSINELFVSVATKNPIKTFTVERKLSWSAEENQVGVKVEGTARSPFYLEVIASHNALTSATVELTHKQDWTSIPKHATLSLAGTTSENNHEITLTLVADEVTKIAKASLEYSFGETSVSIESLLKNEFEMVPVSNAGFVFNGTVQNGEVDGTLGLQFNGKASEDKLNAMWTEDSKYFQYTFTQTFTDKLAQNAKFKIEKIAGGVKLSTTWNDQEMISQFTISSEQIQMSIDFTSQTEERNALLTISKAPVTISLTHNFELVESVPKKLTVSSNVDSLDNNNMRISITADGQNSEIMIKKVENEGLIEYSFQHNLQMLGVPEDISISYRPTPFEVFANWGEIETSFQLHEDRFSVRQNALEVLPKFVSVGVQFTEDSTTLFSHQIDVTVDQYKFNHQLLLKKDLTGLSITDDLKKGESSLLEASINSQLSLKTGLQNVTFKQSLSEVMNSFGYSVEYTIGESTGNVAVTYGTEDPISVAASYNMEQENAIQLQLSHNIQEISAQIPMTSEINANVQKTGTTTTYTATFTDGDIEKEVSFVLSRPSEKVFDVSFTHNFEALEQYLPSFNANLDLLSNDKDIDASITFTINSVERYLKVHATKTEDEVIFTIDQKLFEEQATSWRNRRHQSPIPDKASIHLKKTNSDFTSEVSFRMGPKRRYLNVTFSKPASRSRTLLKLKIDHNLNKLLPARLPTSSVLKYNSNSTDKIIFMDMDNAEVRMQLTHDDTKYAFTFSQNAKALIKAEVPASLKVEVRNIQTNDEGFSMESTLSLNEYSVDSTVDLSWDERRLSITGTQKGLDSYISSESFFFKVGYSLTQDSAEFTSSHNIDALQQNLRYPKTILVTSSWNCCNQDGIVIATKFSIKADEAEFSNNLKVIKPSENSIAIETNGVRPTNIWTTEPLENILYSGTFSSAFVLGENSYSLSNNLHFEESKSNKDPITQEDFELTGHYDANGIRFNVSMNVPSICSNHIAVTGSASWEDTIAVELQWSVDESKSTIDMSYANGESFTLNLAKDDSRANLLISTQAESQLVLRNNIDSMGYLPKSLEIAVQPESRSLTIVSDNREMGIVFDFESKSISIVYTVDNEEYFVLKSAYVAHPAQKFTGSLKIVPLEIDASSVLNVQFFEPSQGKSHIEFVMKDNISKKQFTFEAYAYLNDECKSDITGGITAESNFDQASFRFSTTVVLHSNPKEFQINITCCEYSFAVEWDMNSYHISSKLPDSFKVHSFDVEASRKQTDSTIVSKFKLAWNEEQKIGITETLRLPRENVQAFPSIAYSYELEQSFFEPETVTLSISTGQQAEWKVVNIGVTEGSGRFFRTSNKVKSEETNGENSLNVIIDVQQTYFDYGNFKTTGAVTVGSSKFETTWAISKLGEEVMTFTENLSYANKEFNGLLSWKQPFTDMILAEFSASTNVQFTTSSLTLQSEVSHSADLEHIPSQFTVTGTANLNENSWVMQSEGVEIISLKDGYELTEDALTAHLSWKHPFKQWFTPSLDTSFTAQIGEGSVKIVSEANYASDEGPATLATEGTILYGSSIASCEYTVKKNGQEMLYMKEAIRITPYDQYYMMGWRQKITENYLAHFNSSTNVHPTSDSVTIASEITHSAEEFYLPPHFTINGEVRRGASTYESDWKMTQSNGKVLAHSNAQIEKTKSGYVFTLAKNVNMEAITLSIDADVKLEPDLDLRVEIDHSMDHVYIPKNFITTGKVAIAEMKYDSDWKITSEGQDLVILRKKLVISDDSYTILFDWKQPYEELLPKALLFSSTYESDDNSLLLTGNVQYNDDQWITKYHRTDDVSFRDYQITYTQNEKEYQFSSHHAFGTQGLDVKSTAALIIPNDSVLAYYIPTETRSTVTVKKVGQTTNITATLNSNKLENPISVQALWTTHSGNVLFNTHLVLKNSPPETPGADAEVTFTIDRVSGVTVAYKFLPIGLDHQITIRYDQATYDVTIEYIANQGKPITFTLHFGQVIPTLKKVYKTLKQKNVLPSMKPISYINTDSDSTEFVIGVRVRDVPYTLNVLIESGSEQSTFKIFTKRRSTVVTNILTVTGKIVDQESVEIDIEINKGLGKYLNFALGSSVAELKDKVTVIADALVEVLNSFDNFMEGSEATQAILNEKRNKAIEHITKAKEIILEFLTNMHTSSVEMLQGGEDTTNSGLFVAVNAMSTGIRYLREAINKPWLELKKNILSGVATQIYLELKPTLQSVSDILSKVQAGQLFLELVEEGINKFVLAMDKNMEAMLRAAETPLAQFMSVTENKISFKIPLSFVVKDTISAPSWNDISLWVTQSAFSQEIKEKLRVLDQALEIYNQFKAIMNMPFDEILPPFKGHAELSGFRNVRTFDGKRYNYRSACGTRHVLAHDTKYNDFTVTVTYGPTPVITINTRDSNTDYTIKLNSDYSVTDDRDRNIVIPTEHANVLVKRTGDHITVQTNYGLVVTCNFVSELCTIDVSPFYFAHLEGMLGTFNNEPSDDFMGRGHAMVRNAEELAQSWMEPGLATCRGEDERTRCDLTSSDQCSFLFENSESVFSPCFAIEDPRPYLLMCSKDTCSTTTADNGVCRAYAAYARRCSLRGIFLPTPTACKKCDAVNGNVFNSQMQVPVTGADVVFVVERADCLKFRKKEYKKMVGEIHTALHGPQATGNVNYAIVGFGGPDSLAAPHTVTFGNNIFVSTNSETLSSSEERSIVNGLKIGAKSSEKSDILEALSYASQMPLRAGATRSIVLLTCSDCSDESKVPLSTVQQQLVDQGIVLHHLRQKNIQAGRTSKKVYGFSQEQIFAKGSEMPRSELKESSNDQCLSLTDLTGGTMWNSNIIGRDTWEIIGSQISRSVDSATTQDCTCGLTNLGSSIAKCTSSQSRR